MKKFALIVGGGKGIRMGSKTPKQFLELNGLPVIFHTILKFVGIADEILVVIPAGHIQLFNELYQVHHQQFSVKLVEGGATRQQSVMNGLKELHENGIVAVHDAVRPLISQTLISKLYADAEKFGNAVPVTQVKESLRKKEKDATVAVDRDIYLVVQTPQCFWSEQLMQAYNVPGIDHFSDDASVFENAGNKIHHIEGESFNMKITYAEDLRIATAMITNE